MAQGGVSPGTKSGKSAKEIEGVILRKTKVATAKSRPLRVAIRQLAARGDIANDPTEPLQLRGNLLHVGLGLSRTQHLLWFAAISAIAGRAIRASWYS